jgi:DNA primase
VGGSQQSGLFLAQEMRPGLPALIVEGEFDALLAWQELHDLVNVVTLGSAAESPDTLTIRSLLGCPLILLCYDNDAAGRMRAEVWRSLTPRARVCCLPHGKDITEFVVGGGDLRGWIESALAFTETESKEAVAC